MSTFLQPLFESLSKYDGIQSRRGVSLTISVLVAAILIYRKQSSHTSAKALSPPSYPLIGNALEVIKHYEDWDEWAYSLMKKFDGKTFELKMPGMPKFHCFSSPEAVAYILKDNFDGFEKGDLWQRNFSELLGHGIFSVDGDKWRVQRKSISHIFTVKSFRDHYTKVFTEEIHKLRKVLEEAADNGQIIDMHDLLHRYALETFTIVAFSHHLNLLDNPTKEADEFCTAFNKAQNIIARRFFIPVAWLEEKFMGQKKVLDECIATMDKVVYRVIKERHEDPHKDEYTDLLSRFMMITDDDGQPLSDQTLREFIMNMLIAGRDTTAQALSWTMFLMAKVPKTINNIRKEATDILDEINPTYQQIQDLTYTHAAFMEGLRLHPSVPYDQKMAIEDTVFPDGTIVKKGEWASWFPYAMGRLESAWGPDALEFKPERWLVKDPNGRVSVKQENQFKYPVFNAGPRICLGMNMAILEGKITLAMLTREFDFEILEDPPVVPEKSITHLMKYGMSVRVKRLNQVA